MSVSRVIVRFLVWTVAVASLLSVNATAGVRSFPTTRPAAKSKSSSPQNTGPARTKPIEGGSDSKPKAPSRQASSSPLSTEKAASAPTPQVEIYIPSVTKLADAARKSRTADLYRSISNMIRLPGESSEDFDIAAILSIVKKIAAWPDSQIILTTYTQDREGRPRWAIKIDWPLAEVRKRIQEILDDEAAQKLIQDIQLKGTEKGAYQLELPDLILAVLIPSENGTLISSSRDLVCPASVFGQDVPAEKKTPAKKMLLYCRLNMQAADDDENQSSSNMAVFSFLKDLRYGISLDENGLWRERLNLQWNMIVGSFIKSAVKRVKSQFDCPIEAYLNGAVNVQIGGTMAESLADLPTGTLGSRVDDEMAFSVVPGTGFLPLPDVYFQFNASRSKRIMDSIRKAIEKDNQKRQDEDTPIAWHESQVDGVTVFWKNDADGSRGLMPASFRPVIFFEPATDDQKALGVRRLIVVSTTTTHDDAVHRWLQLKKNQKALTQVPNGKDVHWQIILIWKQVYTLLQPYLALITSSSEHSGPAPSVDELAAALPDSKFQLKIDLAGLDVRHVGPLPLGSVYVPAITAMSLSSTGNSNSEAQRERIACRQLRVLYHHAKLFRQDYGRWPANVAELDGYIDFQSHPYLLNLRPKDRNLVGNITAIFSARKEPKPREDAGGLDDSLYEIELDDALWRLQIRQNEFIHYKTIYIDQDGEIHRVGPGGKPARDSKTAKSPDNPRKSAVAKH